MTHRILIAVDDPNMRMSLEFMFRREGFDVSVAHNDAATLAAVAAQPPELVLLDLNAAGHSSFDVCQALRAQDVPSGPRIVLLSAKGRDTDIAKGLALGADAYLTKPCPTRALLQQANALLEVTA